MSEFTESALETVFSVLLISWISFNVTSMYRFSVNVEIYLLISHMYMYMYMYFHVLQSTCMYLQVFLSTGSTFKKDKYKYIDLSKK